MNYDLIIVGLGAMGSAAAYQAAKKGDKVLGIDRFSPPHQFGSTHGETRVTRRAIGEGSFYSPLAIRSYEIFREIEQQTGSDLLTITGGLAISKPNGKAALHGNSDFIEETVSAARRFQVEHRKLNAEEISRDFPRFRLDGDEDGYFENEMGFLRPENCVAAQLKLAQKFGAQINCDERVTEIRSQKESVEIITDKGIYRAGQVVLTAGPWISELLGPVESEIFRVYRQVFYWFDVSNDYENFTVNNFPIFIWELGRWENDFVYGFPAINGKNGGIKLATETYLETSDPNNVNREVSSEEIETFYKNYIENRISSVTRKCLRTTTCLYTVAPNSRFVIDRLTDDERIIVASPCSGHGFKHSAAIGEVIAEMVFEGRSRIDISAFSFNSVS
jgi:sarcosine oxidase